MRKRVVKKEEDDDISSIESYEGSTILEKITQLEDNIGIHASLAQLQRRTALQRLVKCEMEVLGTPGNGKMSHRILDLDAEIHFH